MDFTVENVETELGVSIQSRMLFPNLQPQTAPDWLKKILAQSSQLALVSEKARSEFLVAPILLAARELTGDAFSILSGHRLDVDAERNLVGECDFILALSDSLPRLRAPLMTIVEAKRNDIEAGLGQCIAQMLAASVYNQRAGRELSAIFGCVTTGENWQFLKLRDVTVHLDRKRWYINDVEDILGVFFTVYQEVTTTQ